MRWFVPPRSGQLPGPGGGCSGLETEELQVQAEVRGSRLDQRGHGARAGPRAQEEGARGKTAGGASGQDRTESGLLGSDNEGGAVWLVRGCRARELRCWRDGGGGCASDASQHPAFLSLPLCGLLAPWFSWAGGGGVQLFLIIIYAPTPTGPDYHTGFP